MSFAQLPNIKFAPLNVPFPRRRQTAAVAMWMFLVPLFVVIFLAVLFTPRLTLLALGYLVFIFIDKSHETGGRAVAAFRKFIYWTWVKDFFPINLEKTTDLDPAKNYIFGYHPHGIIGLGAWINFATEASQFSEKFPGINLRLLTLETNFLIPLWREVLLSLGICSVSRKSCENVLKKGPGNSIMIVVGGAAEALHAFPGTNELVIKSRYGFVKLALRNGASLVPVYSFGENDIWDQVPNPKGSVVHTVQTSFRKYFSFSSPLFHGRGFINYDYGLLPYRRHVVSVVGTPIDCPKTESPSDELVQEYHQKYLEGLQAIFDKYKDQYAKDRKGDLTFI
ncbi:diacylglycerol acyltransferase [Polychytrium aggregatum]|uniref:diacylglycerol acyltransferase n=1 Tax=Polychytrium aggregatum TaxID=110093 RepID=UPI0022FEB34C|nr:diacylglycerol acyltransferase [Polychytrium aggregatum]KAI9205895.1 diacylglycerol acyltransferase [Polychytrium aggregatum]